ncbi:alpha/beta fold hydrolase [Youngiibacter multivorans]|uniref:Pimeloyl-ACP methyl ester carboxylesterase n=1 Tax=Youngiibacter multivorans TaxID=937251 RepID=A0ABS4G0D0_9CLOT|nr:alpha/beta hydrolase [Youngiibacter multivorans]MBP1918009.1 pimeloyl-ACP methyl ester carboxylesterase [Youngiibacter multivorans]
MRFIEFGDIENPGLLLIHGAGTSWNLKFAPVIEELSKNYRLIIPVLDGHDPEIKSEFLSLEEEAVKIEEYVMLNHSGNVQFAHGGSMGGNILIVILARGRIRVGKAVLESPYCVPMGIFAQVTSRMLALQIAAMKKGGAGVPLMKKITGIRDSTSKVLFDGITGRSMRRSILECHRFQIPPRLLMTNTEVIFWQGSEEPFAFKSAKNLRRYLPDMKIRVFEASGHGQLMDTQPEKWLSELKKEFKG